MNSDFSAFSAFHSFDDEFSNELNNVAVLKPFTKGEIIVKTGSYLPFVPIVTKGLVKVYTTHEVDDKELLLYYIKPNESCIMTFNTALKGLPSRIEAVAEEDTELLLIPSEKMEYLMAKNKAFSSLFFNQFNLRYLDLLDTINSLVFESLDKRLLSYLKEKEVAAKGKLVELKHRDIANDLGTAREVISRLLKRLETEKKIEVKDRSFKVIEM